ncbi:NAD-dependent epimerase/dehydratase family protein [Rhodovulum sp. MB263]|uniref:NAD-dependent epimerase/dehydratase family protein n=1 Tax=Rhodovulum sp. (strain MB263) TaxID=308754 RepID=UPI0009B7CCC7|nr:NAD-dependent epimerase/dehydratase family protein [Rhodovulum sp. MB263]ARC87287.1 hypothetical protein B5V46_00910 [Rhodovulum sp. MB263]
MSKAIPVLVTGGAGYIGSHTCRCLSGAGYLPVVFDNLSTGHADAVRWRPLVEGDTRDRAALVRAIRAHAPVAVIHFAAAAYVGHAIDAIAIGAGPASFADMLTQEFQWSRSLVTILLRHTPRCLSGLPPRLKLQFLFTQSIYPGLVAFMLAGSLIPAATLALDMRFVGVTYPSFLGHSLPILVTFLGIAAMLRRDGHSRPADAPVLGWERILFPCAQWPWAAWGALMALRDRLWGGFVDCRITPKGTAAEARLPLRLIAPYFLLGALAPVLARPHVQEAAGFYLLSLLNGGIYVVLVAAIRRHHLAENRGRPGDGGSMAPMPAYGWC